MKPIALRVWALSEKTFEAHFNCDDLSRFALCLAKPDMDMHVTLQFSVDKRGFYRVTGSAQSEVWLCCQNCLEVFSFNLVSQTDLYLVSSEEQAAHLDRKQDYLVIQKTHVNPVDLIEDDLIMALPMIPKHARCPQKI